MGLQEKVRRLHGCLPELPGRLRQVLQLRTDVNVARRMTATQVASRLRVPVTRISGLETKALVS